MNQLSIRGYFSRLLTGVGDGWNRFWFNPSDALPLAFTRIATGLAALYIHLTYTFDAAYFFKRGGLLPFSLTEQYQPIDAAFNPASLSYLSYLHTPTELQVAHALGAIILVLFTIGLFSRVTSILALIVTLSYIHRAPLATSEVEPILAMLQFYLCLGPCGARLSVDHFRALRTAAVNPTELEKLKTQKLFSTTIATRLIQVHTCLAVLMMGMAKLSGPSMLVGVDEWYDPWGAGEAVWWLIARPQSRMIEQLTYLRDWPYLVQAWTHAIVLFELTFPILIWNRLARPLMLGIAVVVWSSLALISGVAMMSVLLIAASFSFYAPTLLQHWVAKTQRTGTDTPAKTQSAPSTA